MTFNTENFDALKRYKSTEVDCRTWLHVPSGTLWSTSSDTHQVDEMKNLKGDDSKVPKQAEAKRDGVINPQNYNFNDF